MNSKAASAFLNKQTHLKVLYFLEHFLAKLVGQFGHSDDDGFAGASVVSSDKVQTKAFGDVSSVKSS